MNFFLTTALLWALSGANAQSHKAHLPQKPQVFRGRADRHSTLFGLSWYDLENQAGKIAEGNAKNKCYLAGYIRCEVTTSSITKREEGLWRKRVSSRAVVSGLLAPSPPREDKEVPRLFRNSQSSWVLTDRHSMSHIDTAQRRAKDQCHAAGYLHCKVLDSFITKRVDTWGPGKLYYTDTLVLGYSRPLPSREEPTLSFTL